MVEKNTDLAEIEGLRLTKYRKLVYEVLLEQRNHPTAADVFDAAKKINPDIALATVYNSLEALVEHGAVRQVNFERESSRYCPNLTEHGHFHDSNTGIIHDVNFKDGATIEDFLTLPDGATIDDLEITIRGKLVSSK